ncbi:MAG: hypothetical protein Q7T20_15925 [Saprospiraceae bacterium]|nr:hypothetical protein [Saprospiraceae bacterium]
MRKLFKATLLLACTFMLNTAFAQVDLRWDTHGVGFSAPGNLRVTANNANEFSAESSDLFLTIYAEQDGEVTEETLAEALVAAAEEMEYDNITDVDELKIDDFTGYYVEGTKDGVGAVIITLLDQKSSTNLVIAIAYTSDAARNKAIAIGDSFYAFD